jgi:hypothetical protein
MGENEENRNPSMSAEAMREQALDQVVPWLARGLDTELASLLSGGTSGGTA